MRRIDLLFSFFKTYFISRLHMKIFHKKKFFRYSRKRLSGEETNDFLFEQISIGKPFFASRVGATESFGCGLSEMKKYKLIKKIPSKRKEELFQNAGMFSIDDNGIDDFRNVYTSALNDADSLCLWTAPFEDYFLKYYCKKDIKKATFCGMVSFFYDNPWTLALEGKKVLVISPFSESIEKQYNNKGCIFKNKKVLPDFSLLTYKSINSIKGEDIPFKTWNDALELMINDISKLDFDIAIIGCGSYGLPMGSYIKRMGKIAIHTGGLTQLFFGVKGKRWENDPEYADYINDNWISPNENERPKNSNAVEKGCYW